MAIQGRLLSTVAISDNSFNTTSIVDTTAGVIVDLVLSSSDIIYFSYSKDNGINYIQLGELTTSHIFTIPSGVTHCKYRRVSGSGIATSISFYEDCSNNPVYWNDNLTPTDVVYPIAPPPTRSVGFLYVSNNVTPTTILASNTYYPFNATSLELEGFNRDFTQLNARLTCAATLGKWYRLTMNACITMDTSNIELRMRIAVNGTPLDHSCSQVTLIGNPQSGRRESFASHTFAYLVAGDYIETYIANFTTTDHIHVVNLQLSAEVV